MNESPSHAPCPHCCESSGYEARVIPATWWDPSFAEADHHRPCPHCGGTGLVESEPVTLEDLESEAAEERR